MFTIEEIKAEIEKTEAEMKGIRAEREAINLKWQTYEEILNHWKGLLTSMSKLNGEVSLFPASFDGMSTAQAVLTIMKRHDGERMPVFRVQKELVASGKEVNRLQVAVALSRLFRDGKIGRAGKRGAGLYVYKSRS